MTGFEKIGVYFGLGIVVMSWKHTILQINQPPYIDMQTNILKTYLQVIWYVLVLYLIFPWTTSFKTAYSETAFIYCAVACPAEEGMQHRSRLRDWWLVVPVSGLQLQSFPIPLPPSILLFHLIHPSPPPPFLDTAVHHRAVRRFCLPAATADTPTVHYTHTVQTPSQQSSPYHKALKQRR